MPILDVCHCIVNIANLGLTYAQRIGPEAVTYPELVLLEHLHGPNSVSDVVVVGSVERSRKDEKMRLAREYDPQIVNLLFPGANPMFEERAARDIPRQLPEPTRERKAAPEPATPEVDREEEEEEEDTREDNDARQPTLFEKPPRSRRS